MTGDVSGRKPSDVTSDLITCPYAAYAKMRAAGHSAFWDEHTDAWYVTNEAAVRTMLKDRRFRSRGASPVDSSVPVEGQASVAAIEEFLGKWPVFSDDPASQNLKRALSPAFNKRAGEKLRGSLRSFSEGLLAIDPGGGVYDLLAHFARPIAEELLRVTFNLRPDDLQQLFSISSPIMSYLHAPNQEPQLADAALGAVERLAEFTYKWLNGAEFSLTKSILLKSRNTHSAEDITAMMAQLVTGSIEPTTHTILSVLSSASQKAEVWELVADQQWSDAASRALFYDSGFHFSPRRASQAVEDFHPDIKTNERVVGVLVEANKHVIEKSMDASVPSNQFAFGLGRHYCLGAPLAIIAIEEALRTASLKGLLSRIRVADIEKAPILGATVFTRYELPCI